MQKGKSMKKREAQEAGLMFFKGNICPRHVELDGLRRAKSGGCPSCIRERTNKRRKKMGRKEYNRRQNEKRAAIKAGEHVRASIARPMKRPLARAPAAEVEDKDRELIR
jgi:hypothetical protein